MSKVGVKKSELGVQIYLQDGNLNPREAMTLAKTIIFMIGEHTGLKMTRSESRTLDEILDKMLP